MCERTVPDGGPVGTGLAKQLHVLSSRGLTTNNKAYLIDFGALIEWPLCVPYQPGVAFKD